jgi:tartrate-resistant acid phosphatase type 5
MGRTLGAICLAAACAALACSSETEGSSLEGAAGAAGEEPAEPLRFVAVGDTGKANATQLDVAAAIRDQCAAEGCDFVLLLGDNLYPEGAEDVDDDVWQSAFEEPYQEIDLPFYAVLGNHDYGGKFLFVDVDGLGNQFERGPVEVAYSQHSDKWRMPATHYTMRQGPVGFVAIDTDSILWKNRRNGNQWTWWPGALAEVADAPWVFAVGHHPYRSNGDHGNAGDYQTLDLSIHLDQLDGEEVEEFMEENVCGNVDLYLSGHDHDRQWLSDPSLCAGTELVVSGAGAEVKPLDDPERNPVAFQDGTTPGFLYMVVDETTLTGRFIDASGATAFERTLTK